MRRVLNHLLITGIVLVFASVTLAQSKTTEQRGVNSISVTKYVPRDISNESLPVSLLTQEWDTEREVRWDIAAMLVLLAEQSYSDDDETLDYLLRGMGFSKWVAVKNSTMAAHVLSGNDVTVIVFRGTNFTEYPDWYKNLSVDFVTTRHGRFHSGFTEAYKLVRGEVQQFVSDTKPKHVWITGHSLGGAMSVACGVDLGQSGNVKPRLVTFGQPRYADSQGAQWIDGVFKKRYVRFVRGDDIVPRVPFYVPWVFPYAHAGNLVAIKDDAITLADSIVSTPNPTASYCGRCGGVTKTAAVEVYQPSIEPPPLTQAEFQKSLQMKTATVAGASSEPRAVTFIPNYFSDHSMTGYRDLIRIYRSWKPQMDR